MAKTKKKKLPLTKAELNAEPSVVDKDLQLYRYWIGCTKRAEKLQPRTDWDLAENRLKCLKSKEDNSRGGNPKPYKSGWRGHYEGLKSFLDQNEPTFEVSPTEPFLTDETVIKQAECDIVYLKYVWNEQNCQKAESRKLDSTIQRNVGFTMPYFDVKKWMPGVRYIPARNVLFDPDTGGCRDKDSWMGFYEDVSTEELRVQNPSITVEEMKRILQSAGSTIDENKLDELAGENPEDRKLYTTVRVYHIFARNDAAVRIMQEEAEEKQLPKSTIEELRLTTPKRYFQFVKGYHKPLRDSDWPFELDENEFPITSLMFNTPVESDYGFGDYIQMERLDQLGDNIFFDIDGASFWEGLKKFAGGPEANDLKETEIEGFLKNPKKVYLANFLDNDGNPKIKQIDTGELSKELVGLYDLVDKQRKEASSLGELLAETAEKYKDVTAIAARIHDANIHQRVNRRLGGPEGYEMSIAEDAIKILEIAHQKVPQYSLLEVDVPKMAYTETGQIYETGEMAKEFMHDVPWSQAIQYMNNGARLIKLGVDAIVGEELAQYWRTSRNFPPVVFKLTTRIRVLPGSTRSVTKEHKAAVLKQFYTEIFFPIYEAMGRLDLAVRFIKNIGHLAGIDKVENLLPTLDEIKQWRQQKEMLAGQVQNQAQGQGQPQQQPEQVTQEVS